MPAAALVEPGDLSNSQNFHFSRNSSLFLWGFFSRTPPTILLTQMPAAVLVDPGDLLHVVKLRNTSVILTLSPFSLYNAAIIPVLQFSGTEPVLKAIFHNFLT